MPRSDASYDEIAARLTRAKEANGGFVSARSYLCGWTHGTRDGLARICLLHTSGKRRGVDRFDFEHYFYVRTDDLDGKGTSVLRKLRDGVQDRHRKSAVRRWEPDPVYPEWTRIYVDVPGRYFYTRAHVLLGERRFVDNPVIEGRERRTDLCSPSLLVARVLEAKGIPTFEGDVHPMRRFVTDHPIRYPRADEITGLYFDIETDDRPKDLFQKLGRYRILSIGGVDDDGEESFYLLEEDSDRAERAMLTAFFRDLERYDALYAWNGSHFDFYYVFERARRLGLAWKWWRCVPVDLLQVLKRYHFRAGNKAASYALDKIARHVLPEDRALGKMDLAAALDAKYPGWSKDYGGAVGTFAAWYLDPDLLRDYNVRDCEVLRRVEEATSYAHLDFTFSDIGNCFADDWNVSTKIDGLMLRKGLVDGVHFQTVDRRKQDDDAERGYEGGYVHEPVRGLHRDVCAFDFKSLYPSMMQTFNISPETWVSAEEAGEYDPDELITTPIGTTFVRPWQDDAGEWQGIGFIPQMFTDTLHRRKKYTDLQKTVEVGGDLFRHYDRLAYSYKRLGLSFYGELGNYRGRYYNPEIALSVTLSGQYFTRETIKIADAAGFPTLYGDTDSIYVRMDPSEGEAFVARCHAVYQDWLPDYNAPPELCTVKLEFEDTYATLCLVNKKRYFGRMSMHKGVSADHLEVKGLEVMRSDGTELARQLQTTIMRAIAFDDCDANEAWNLVLAERERVLSGGIPVAALTETKGLSKHPDEYKKTTPPHVRVVRKLNERGKEWFVGMKVPLIWTVGTYVPRVEHDPDLSFVENVERLQAWREAEAIKVRRCTVPPKPEPVHVDEYDPTDSPYDAPFYWNKKVYPPTQRIVEVAFPARDWRVLNSEEAGKADRRLARYRKGLLSPVKREDTKAKIRDDGKLSERDRRELAAFFIDNVLRPGSRG